MGRRANLTVMVHAGVEVGAASAVVASLASGVALVSPGIFEVVMLVLLV